MRSPSRLAIPAALASVLALAGCASSAEPAPQGEAPAAEPQTLKVVAVQSPMTDVVEAAASAIEDGFEIELVTVSDYVTANTILNEGDVYANFSQHVPYMEGFNAANDGTLVGVQPVYNFTIAFYSKVYGDISELADGDTVAIPDDASNRGRALKLLDGAGVIGLDSAVDHYAATVDDIAENPLNLRFQEVGIPLLNAAYDEAALVFQWPSHIAALGLNPHDDGLITELDDRFALHLVVQDANAGSPATTALKAAFSSDAVRAVIEENPTIEVAF